MNKWTSLFYCSIGKSPHIFVAVEIHFTRNYWTEQGQWTPHRADECGVCDVAFGKLRMCTMHVLRMVWFIHRSHWAVEKWSGSTCIYVCTTYIVRVWYVIHAVQCSTKLYLETILSHVWLHYGAVRHLLAGWKWILKRTFALVWCGCLACGHCEYSPRLAGQGRSMFPWEVLLGPKCSSRFNLPD